MHDNTLCRLADLLREEQMTRMACTFLTVSFKDNRHLCRINKLTKIENGQDSHPRAGQSAISTDLPKTNIYGKLSRYGAHLVRQFCKALHEMQRPQSARSGQPVLAPVVVRRRCQWRTAGE